MQPLDITLLAYEGPIYRAYGAILKQLGYYPKCIVKFFNGNHRWRWLPKVLRSPLLCTLEAEKALYWPKKFLCDPNMQALCRAICETYGLPNDFFACLNAHDRQWIPNECEVRYCDWGTLQWKSDAVFRLLQSFGPQTFLYTGGGLVPSRILTLPGTEFVHVHPGFLPYTRGSDGILWSLLTRGQPGVSCFYMVPRLDEGNLILTEEVAPVAFKNSLEMHDTQTLYRFLFSFYDPAIRALCLKHVLERFGNLSHLPTTVQRTSEGITYHFMHGKLKRVVLEKMFA